MQDFQRFFFWGMRCGNYAKGAGMDASVQGPDFSFTFMSNLRGLGKGRHSTVSATFRARILKFWGQNNLNLDIGAENDKISICFHRGINTEVDSRSNSSLFARYGELENRKKYPIRSGQTRW